MDVYGKRPKSETGEYFRRNVWGWRPLADYVLASHPVRASGCRYWQSNDGAGLGPAASEGLARDLEEDIANGAAAAYVAARDARLAGLPNEPCKHCGGTGIRTDAVGLNMRQPSRVIDEKWSHKPDHPRYGQVGWCNGCDGRGWDRPVETFYSLEVEDIRDFAAFLRDCGGFEIC
jgi:hypothetical protein